MKKVMIWGAVVILLFLAAGGINKTRYVQHFFGGISVGGGSDRYDDNDPNETIDSMRVIGGYLYVFSGGDTLSYYYPAAGYDDIDDYVVMDLPDSLHLTAGDTLDATYNGRDVFNYAAASIRISIPAGLTGMPVGTTVNFFQEGAGKFVFNAQATVTIVSPLDSIATNKKGDVVGLKKIAANKYRIYGNLTD